MSLKDLYRHKNEDGIRNNLRICELLACIPLEETVVSNGCETEVQHCIDCFADQWLYNRIYSSIRNKEAQINTELRTGLW